MAKRAKIVFRWVWYDPILQIYCEGDKRPPEWHMPNAERVLTKWVKDDWGWMPLSPYDDWSTN